MTEENDHTVTTDQEIATPIMTHRVKFYQLNQDTNWEDKGTGHCIYREGTDGNPDQIIVHSEEDNSVLLTSNVAKRRLYQRQQDTLIVWTEDDNRDLALSFQDPIGCEEMWHCISKKQGGNGFFSADPDSDDLTPLAKSPPEVTLPEPELSNLKEISDLLNTAHTLHEKDKLAAFVLTESYIDKLIPLFETCEDLESITDLNLLYNVLLGILTLNDQQIIEWMLQDDHVTNVMGILEYNPKTPGMRAKHREFIKIHGGNVKQVVEIADEQISRKIDQTFRLEYLQGIFLHNEGEERIEGIRGNSDEGLMGVINNMIYQNHLEIVNHVQNNHFLLAELFTIFKDPEASTERRDDIIRFVHQLCHLTKPMQNSARVNTFRSLAPYGFLDLLCVALAHPTKSFRVSALNILASFTDLDVASVRSHIMIQSKDTKSTIKPLIEVIVEQCTKDDDHDLKVQYFEILRLLLDPNGNIMSGPSSSANDPMSKQAPETDEFLSLFYDKYTSILLQPIEQLEIKPMSLKGPIEPLEMSPDQAQLRLYICDFLNFAVRNHGFRSKYVLLSSDFFLKVAQLYRSKYTYIKLVALRFFRACVTLSDDFYNRNLTKHNIFEPTIRVLLDTDGRDCLLNSACLDLLEYIRRENIKPLVTHLIAQFGTVLDTITYISTCKQLRLKYEQNNEALIDTQPVDENNGESSNDKKADGWSTNMMDEEEEEYFNHSDEEEEQQSTANNNNIPKPTTIPLVSYGQDEDTDEEKEAAAQPTTTPTATADVLPTTSTTQAQPENELKRTSEQADIAKDQASSPPPFKSRKKSFEDEEEEDVLAKKAKQEVEKKEKSNSSELSVSVPALTSPPTFKSRKRSEDEDDEEDDVFAKRSSSTSPRQTPLSPKKMVIKTSSIKKMRTSQ